MTTETDRPSHIEARERLDARMAQFDADIQSMEPAPEHTSQARRLDRKTVLAMGWKLRDDLRTLLDTPTQEGVGREEIAWIIIEDDLPHWADKQTVRKVYDDSPSHCDWVKAKATADRILSLMGRSLLPAPKLGEGVEPVAWRVKDPSGNWRVFHTEACAINEVKSAEYLVQPLYAATPEPPQPAPGAPEGWREVLSKRRAIYAYKRDDVTRGVAEREAFRIVVEAHDILERNLAALTSSFAKPGGEALFKLPTDGHEYDVMVRLNGRISDLELEIEALAQSNRRLREGLEAMLDAFPPSPGDSVEEEREATKQARAALKDNGHG